MNKKAYSSALKKTTFEYLSSKKIAKLFSGGLYYDDLFNKCVKENEIGIVSEQRRQEVFNVVYDRIASLDNFLLNEFLNSSISTSKFLLVYAIANTDPLFMEFLLIQYRGARLGNKNYISISDFDDFFSLYKEKNAIVAKWADTTLKQLAGGYRNVLVQSGLGERVKKNIYIKQIIVNPNVIEYLKENGGKDFLEAVMEVK